MSGNLTRDEFSVYWGRGTAESRYELWSRIEADREAIRAETRGELLKDHFKLGDRARSVAMNTNGWLEGTVVLDCGQFIVRVPGGVYRPPKMRSMSWEEKVETIVKELVRHPNRQWSTDIIDAVCRELGLPTEVEE